VICFSCHSNLCTDCLSTHALDGQKHVLKSPGFLGPTNITPSPLEEKVRKLVSELVDSLYGQIDLVVSRVRNGSSAGKDVVLDLSEIETALRSHFRVVSKGKGKDLTEARTLRPRYGADMHISSKPTATGMPPPVTATEKKQRPGPAAIRSCSPRPNKHRITRAQRKAVRFAG
jgi:hypothetical protein